MTSPYFTGVNQRAFGTWPLKGDDLRRALEAAFAAGYRAIDTAQLYDNEETVGAALEACGLPRHDLLVTTKIQPDRVTPQGFRRAVEESLQRLRVDRVDVLLIHRPPPDGDVAGAVRVLETAREAGLARHVGISNFSPAQMVAAQRTAAGPLAANQVEYHPLLDVTGLRRAAAETGIPLAAFCPLARGAVFRHGLFAEIGAAHGKTTAQVVLRWVLQSGAAVTVMSTRPENILGNFAIMDLTLSEADMARIDALSVHDLRVVPL